MHTTNFNKNISQEPYCTVYAYVQGWDEYHVLVIEHFDLKQTSTRKIFSIKLTKISTRMLYYNIYNLPIYTIKFTHLLGSRRRMVNC